MFISTKIMHHIGLIDADNTGFPNLALMKLAKYHKIAGDTVEWYTPLEKYDAVYISKVFTFTKENGYIIDNDTPVWRGGTGYGMDRPSTDDLPEKVDMLQPDYSIYPYIDKNTAYGFLTRGCPNRCSWCFVPTKEGKTRPYMDVEEIAQDRKRLILMDNNILASGYYGRDQIVKIIDKGYRVDFNQAMDARLVDKDTADLLARVKWIRFIRFACDTKKQIDYCSAAIQMIRDKGFNGQFMIYTMLHGDISECIERINIFKAMRNVNVMAQPYIDATGTKPPQWQKDMARWANRRWLFRSCDFEDYIPRKGITGRMIIEQNR